MDSHDDDVLGGNNFSPNIKNLADEQERAERLKAEQQAAEKKAKETVAIDGIAFHEDEINYHSKNIQEKDGKDLFVKVEGTERRKREAEAEALKYAVSKKKAQERLERDLIRSMKEQKEAEKRKIYQAEKAIAKERSAKENEKKRLIRDYSRSVQKDISQSREPRKSIKRILIFIIIILLIVCCAVAGFLLFQKKKTEEERRIRNEETYINDTLSFEEKLEQAGYLIGNNRLKEAMTVYEELLEKDLSAEDRIKVYVHRSMAIYKSSDYSKSHLDQVKSDASAAYEIDHDSTRALGWLIELYDDLGESAKADDYKRQYDEIMDKKAEESKKNNPNDYGRG